MGLRGPRPQSEEMKQRKGNPGKRKPKVDNSAAEPILGHVEVPCFLRNDKIAAAEWRRISKDLTARRILTKSNIKALELYCLNYSLARQAKKDIDENGTQKTTEKGYPVQNPSVAIMNKAQAEMRNWLKVLESTKVHAPKKEKNPLQEFLDRKKNIRGGGIRMVK